MKLGTKVVLGGDHVVLGLGIELGVLNLAIYKELDVIFELLYLELVFRFELLYLLLHLALDDVENLLHDVVYVVAPLEGVDRIDEGNLNEVAFADDQVDVPPGLSFGRNYIIRWPQIHLAVFPEGLQLNFPLVEKHRHRPPQNSFQVINSSFK